MNTHASNWQYVSRRTIRAPLVTLATLLFLASLGLLLLALVRPGESERFIRWWLLFAGVAMLGTTAVIVARSLPGPPRGVDRYGRRTGEAAADLPDRLQQIDRMLTSATWSSREYRARLRPVLLTIAGQRLRTQRGIDIDQAPDSAIAVLGEEVWEHLTTPVEAPGSDGRGLTVAQIGRIVATLEDVGGSDNNRR